MLGGIDDIASLAILYCSALLSPPAAAGTLPAALFAIACAAADPDSHGSDGNSLLA